jgi:arylsulfatase A-like enzyme
MHRLLFLILALGAPLAGSSAATNPVPARKNVLFLIADDLNNLLGCYGDPRAKTPHLDQLAARGVRFDRAYCSYPLCGPSRNSMLTGLYPNSTGILGNSQLFRQTIPAQVSLPQAFRHAGYLSVRLGKLYHYAVPNAIGTDGHDDPASWEIEFNPAGVDRLVEQSKMSSLTPGNYGGGLAWYASPSADAKHTDAILATDAEWVLERCAQRNGRPFFVAVGFFRPHAPFTAPKDPYFGYFPEAQMPVVQGVKEDQADIPAPALASRRAQEEAMTDTQRRQAVQAYYASISFMDAQVGRVIAALDRLGLAQNTIVVFTSDHGYHLGEHGLWKKQSLFEESARVPLLIVAPGVSERGAVAKTPVSHVDLYPTLAELAGVSPPANLQGQSLVPILKNPSTTGRGWALTQVGRRGPTEGEAEAVSRKAGKAGKAEKAEKADGKERGRRKAAAGENEEGGGGRRTFGYSLRTARWRYTEWGEAGRDGRELYDHDSDPRELTNLASVGAHAQTVQELSKQLAAAAKASYPPSGLIPERAEGMWSPLLVR